MVQFNSAPHPLYERVEGLLRLMEQQAEAALAALERSSLDGLFAALDERDATIREADPLLSRILTERYPGGDRGDRRSTWLDLILMRARAAQAANTRLEIALAASREQVHAELEQIDGAEARSARYRPNQGPQAATLDLRR